MQRTETRLHEFLVVSTKVMVRLTRIVALSKEEREQRRADGTGAG